MKNKKKFDENHFQSVGKNTNEANEILQRTANKKDHPQHKNFQSFGFKNKNAA